MPNLENIVRNFEMGYLSPPKDALKAVGAHKEQPRNFVKKIVAAFEVKYNVYNEIKTAHEARDTEETSSRVVETLRTKRNSGLFSSPLRSCYEESRNGAKTCDDPKQTPEKLGRQTGEFSRPSKDSAEDSKAFRRSGVYGSHLKFFDGEVTCKDPELQDDKAMVLSGKIVSMCDRSKEAIHLDIYTSPVHFKSQDTKNSDGFDQEEFGMHAVPLSTLDDTVTLHESIDLNLTLPEPDETIWLENHTLCKTSTKIDECNWLEEKSVVDAPPVIRNDKTPKIIGAFLKKPIEVEDTSIEWIPITGKKLPRKKSLKKLLTSWTTRYFDRNRSISSCERTLSEDLREPRALRDSGYDDKCSYGSSSSSSLMSITEAMLQQEVSSFAFPSGTNAPTFNTFHPRRPHDESTKSEVFHNVRPNDSKQKLILTEVPREQLKVDLMPTYVCLASTMPLGRKASTVQNPPPSQTTMTMAALPKLPKHPHLSSIPKHPFVSLTKMDEPEYQKEPVIIKNKLYEVEFRRSCTDINAAKAFCYSSSSSASCSEIIYDVPRRYLSKSETQIPDACRVEFRQSSEPIYDIPRRRCQEKFHMYEDTLTRRRKKERCDEEKPLSEYYSSSSDTEPHYATVKPINHSRDMLQSFLDDATSTRNAYPF